MSGSSHRGAGPELSVTQNARAKGAILHASVFFLELFVGKESPNSLYTPRDLGSLVGNRQTDEGPTGV
jgi:hypothetical protein